MIRTIKLHAVYSPAGRHVLEFHKFKKDAVAACKKLGDYAIPVELRGTYAEKSRKP